MGHPRNLLLLLVLVAAASSAIGQNRGFSELSLNLDVLKPEVVSLEPLSLKLTLENPTDKAITVDTSLSFHVNSVSLEIKQPSGKIVKPSQLSYLNGRTISIPKDIGPGDKMEASQLFGFRLADYMAEPGEYKLRATFRNSEDKALHSKWVRVTVTEPAMTDAEAYKYLSDKAKSGSDFQAPYYEWSPEELEGFVMRFPETTYATYVQFSLGMLYYEKEKARSIEHFRSLMNVPKFIFADEVDVKLKQLESQLKQN